MTANEHITAGSNCYEKVKTFKYLGSLLINQNYIHEEITAGNSCYYSVQTLLSSRLQRIWKLKYIKQQYCQLCYMGVKHGLLH